nr:unnamed protein product [Digitaria exilis]
MRSFTSSSGRPWQNRPSLISTTSPAAILAAQTPHSSPSFLLSATTRRSSR